MRDFKPVKTAPEGVKLPVRSTENSAGYDLFAVEDMEIKPKETVISRTGVKAQMNKDEVFMIYPRSSMGIKKHCVLANLTGVIDSDYFENPDNDGEILMALYNYGTDAVQIKKGDKVAQGIFTKYLITDTDNATGTRAGGIGSTGK